MTEPVTTVRNIGRITVTTRPKWQPASLSAWRCRNTFGAISSIIG